MKVHGVRLYPQTVRTVQGAGGAPIFIHGRISDDCSDFIYIFRHLGSLYAGHTFVSSFWLMDGEDPLPGLREQFGSSLIDAELDGQLMLLRGDDFPSWSARYPDQCQYLLVFREVPTFDLARRLFWDTDFRLNSASWPRELRAVIHCWDDIFWQLFSSDETDVKTVVRSHVDDPKLEMFFVDIDREYPNPSNEELRPASLGDSL